MDNMAICIICNKEFIQKNITQKYCSSTCCKKAWKRRHPDQVNAQQRRRGMEIRTERLLIIPDKTCPQCGKVFKAIEDRMHSYKTFCSTKCREDNGHKIGSSRRTKRRELDRKNCSERICEFCGNLFDPRIFRPYRTVKTCSKSCSQKLSGRKSRQIPEHKARHAFHQRNRKHKIRANGGSVSLQEWEDMKKKFNYTCQDCGKREPEIKLTMDHIDRIRDGGKHIISNIQPLCFSCNSRKQ